MCVFKVTSKASDVCDTSNGLWVEDPPKVWNSLLTHLSAKRGQVWSVVQDQEGKASLIILNDNETAKLAHSNMTQGSWGKKYLVSEACHEVKDVGVKVRRLLAHCQ